MLPRLVSPKGGGGGGVGGIAGWGSKAYLPLSSCICQGLLFNCLSDHVLPEGISTGRCCGH